MNEIPNVVRGTILPDGTLTLDERTTLPAGPVEVTIRPVVARKNGENWFECLQRIRAEREAAGHRFLTEEEGEAYMEEIRDWDEGRLDEARGWPETGPRDDRSK